MKAAVIQRDGGPEVFSFDDVPGPGCAGDAVVIDVETISIDGGDLLARLMTPPSGPCHVAGRIAVGTVRAIGTDAGGGPLAERVGTRAANGSHATQRAASAAMPWWRPPPKACQRRNCVKQDIVAEVHRLNGKRGVDGVVNSVGGKTLAGSVKVLGWRGRLVSVGIAGRGGSAVNAFWPWARNNTLHGVRFATCLQAEYPRAYALVAGCLARVASGELKVEIARVFPLAEAAQAHAFIEGRHAFGRVVMTA